MKLERIIRKGVHGEDLDNMFRLSGVSPAAMAAAREIESGDDDGTKLGELVWDDVVRMFKEQFGIMDIEGPEIETDGDDAVLFFLYM